MGLKAFLVGSHKCRVKNPGFWQKPGFWDGSFQRLSRSGALWASTQVFAPAFFAQQARVNILGHKSVTPLLEGRGLTKRFGDLVANDRVDIVVHAGEVHAILGENGAGKSTLMKMLYGFHRPDVGDILLNGHCTTIDSPQAGRRLGIGMVFQNFTLIPAFTVVENIALFLPDPGVRLKRREIEQRIGEVSERYGLQVDPRARAGDLSVGEQQKVEILKVLLGGARILIFDEPTSVLAPHEVERLVHIFNQLRRDGYAILFITHKLPEVMICADRITVLRRGSVVGSLLRSSATEAELVTMMLGSSAIPGSSPTETETVGSLPPEAAQRSQRIERHSGGAHRDAPVLVCRGIELVSSQIETMANDHGGLSLRGINLEVLPGQIVGVAGVSGNGQKELGEVALGLRKSSAGTVFLFGIDATHWPVEKILRLGVSCIPEDPLLMGTVPGMTVQENMILGQQAKYARRGGLAMDWNAARADAEQCLHNTFHTPAPSLNVPMETLSGGNIQRVVFARELGQQPRLLIAYYPTRGLDIANAEAARRLLLRYREAGTGILLISEDLDELFALSDQLMVMYRGQIVGSFKPQETTAYAVGHLMTGTTVRIDD
jgi:simple sugar transport system ATP-binding protein